MKKLLITGTKQAEFVDSPTPACPTDGVVVKAKVTAISAGTEIRVFRGIAVDDAGKFMHETKPYELPCENGYSMVAEVMEVGKNVEHLAVGERVFVPEPHKEYAAVPSNLAVKLPETIPDEEAVMINILEVAHQGLRQGQPPVGGNVAVVGQGVIGLSALAYANAFGMRTASLDTDSTRLHIAEEMGTRLAASPVEEDAVARVYDLFDGAGADVTCEAASNWAGIRTAMEVTGIDGTVVIIARHTQQPDFNPVGHPTADRHDLRLSRRPRSVVAKPIVCADGGPAGAAPAEHRPDAHSRIRVARTTRCLSAFGRRRQVNRRYNHPMGRLNEQTVCRAPAYGPGDSLFNKGGNTPIDRRPHDERWSKSNQGGSSRG